MKTVDTYIHSYIRSVTKSGKNQRFSTGKLSNNIEYLSAKTQQTSDTHNRADDSQVCYTK